MGQLEDFKLFVTVVDQGSIARASEELRIAKSAVSRRLAQLESRYNVRLVDRQPGTWAITDAGRELYQRAVPMLADADDIEADFVHAGRALQGPLRVTVAYEFGLTYLKPMLFRFIKDHPEIELTLDFDDRTVDLDRENYDLAIRVTSHDLDRVSQVKLGATRHGLFASPDYLAEHGTPRTPQDLQKHALLHYGPDRRPNWVFCFNGKQVRLVFKPALNSNTGSYLATVAASGFGIIRLPDFVVAEQIERGALVPVLADAEFEEFGIHLIHSPNRRINKRMSAFVAAAQQHCSACRT